MVAVSLDRSSFPGAGGCCADPGLIQQCAGGKQLAGQDARGRVWGGGGEGGHDALGGGARDHGVSSRGSMQGRTWQHAWLVHGWSQRFC